MEVSAFAYLESFDDPEQPNKPVTRKLIHCSSEPFVLTWNTTAADVYSDFEAWLDGCLAVAAKEWTDQI